MTPSDSQIRIAQLLEDLARGIRDGSVFLTASSSDPGDTKLSRRFKALTELAEDDELPDGMTRKEWVEDNEKYLEMFDSLILFYEWKKKPKRSRAK